MPLHTRVFKNTVLLLFSRVPALSEWYLFLGWADWRTSALQRRKMRCTQWVSALCFPHSVLLLRIPCPFQAQQVLNSWPALRVLLTTLSREGLLAERALLLPTWVRATFCPPGSAREQTGSEVRGNLNGAPREASSG